MFFLVKEHRLFNKENNIYIYIAYLFQLLHAPMNDKNIRDKHILIKPVICLR